MRSSSPIIPPGSPLHQSSGKNRKLLVTLSTVLGLHMVLLAGLLIQGCKREEPTVTTPQTADFDSELAPLTNNWADDAASTPSPSDDFASEPPPMPASTGVTARTETPPPPIPAVTTTSEAAIAPPITPAQPAAASTITYQVKAGDNLTRIARNHRTTVNAIREANGLRTDRILVGQKLKVPAASASGTGAAAPSPR